MSDADERAPVRGGAPLITLAVHDALTDARERGIARVSVSLDLDRSRSDVDVTAAGWHWNGRAWPYLEKCRDRTIYYWDGAGFEPVSRYGESLIKLVPTPWGAPTFEIDGIKMLPTAQVSPYVDAQRKVGLVEPRGKTVLDTCGGLGYFAACCLAEGAARIQSFEKNPDVIWLRSLNPWSPSVEHSDGRLQLTWGDISEQIGQLAAASVDAVLHDPPRFGIAGELYSQTFYDQIARVLRRNGRLFHYTGTPNKLTSRRDVPSEVSARLQRAGFATQIVGDGVLATLRGGRR
jgi:predicted methyltransferase